MDGPGDHTDCHRLGQPAPSGLLTMDEAELIGADLLRDAYRAQVGPSLLRLDAYLVPHQSTFAL